MRNDGKSLEEVVAREPANLQALQVYADWLEMQGDPRGELISLVVAARSKTAAGKAAQRRARAHFKTHEAAFSGDLANLPKEVKISWENGFIHAVDVDRRYGRFSVEDCLKQALAHPSARLLRRLSVGKSGLPKNDYRPIIRLLSKASLASLNELSVGALDGGSAREARMGLIDGLGTAFPNLEVLCLSGSEIKLQTARFPHLRHLSIDSRTETLPPSTLKAIVGSEWPRLEALACDFGDAKGIKPEVIAPLLAATGFPQLKSLRLVRMAHFDEVCTSLSRSALANQLETIDLPLNNMTDRGALALAGAPFRKLTQVIASYNRLTTAGRRAIARLCLNAKSLPQYSRPP